MEPYLHIKESYSRREYVVSLQIIGVVMHKDVNWWAGWLMVVELLALGLAAVFWTDRLQRWARAYYEKRPAWEPFRTYYLGRGFRLVLRPLGIVLVVAGLGLAYHLISYSLSSR